MLIHVSMFKGNQYTNGWGKKKYPKTSQNSSAKIYKIRVGNGHLYESRFEFFNKKDAYLACKRLKKYKRDCFVRG